MLILSLLTILACSQLADFAPDGNVVWNWNWALGCDFPGNDFANVKSRGEDCSGKCVSTSGCTHYTWTSYNGGTCWMKKSKISKKDAIKINDSTAACGVVFEEIHQDAPIVWNGDWALSCDFPGDDFVNEKSRGEECSNRCVATTGCTHYTWTAHNGGTCWMKHGSVSKNDAVRIRDQTAACGVNPELPTRITVNKTANVDFEEEKPIEMEIACSSPKMSWSSRFVFKCLLPGETELTEEECKVEDKQMPSGTVVTLECRPPFSSQRRIMPKKICENGKWIVKIKTVGFDCDRPSNNNPQHNNRKKVMANKNSTGEKHTNNNLSGFELYGLVGIKIECTYGFASSIFENDCSRHQPVGTEAKYSCLEYYESSGTLTSLFRICGSDGQWTGSSQSFSCRIECGRANRIEKVKLITNGVPTVRGQFPWHAALFRYDKKINSWNYICGGTLIGRKTILTAAHCVTIGETSTVHSVDVFRIDLGKFKREEIDDFVQISYVERIWVHPNYNAYTFDSDLAIVMPKSELTLGHYVRPICFPQTSSSTLEDLQLVENSIGTVVGFGYNEGYNLTDQLHTAKLKILGPAECLEILQSDTTTIQTKSTTYCARNANGTNVCNGDSGGGMYFTSNGLQETKWYLQGVVSLGLGMSEDRNRCDPEKPSIFTRIGRYADWIIKTLSKNH